MRLLLVEDDELLADGIVTSLSLGGFTVDWVNSGEHALHALSCEQFDLCILDIGLPEISGFEVLRQLRAARNSIPVLMLTARDQVADKVKGLDSGADDYLLKPFDVDELKARIRALARRVQDNRHPELSVTINNGATIRIQPGLHQVLLDDQAVKLSPKEFSLLHELAMHRPRILSREQLTELVYGWSDEVDSNAIEVHIHNLRKKLATDLIETVRGVGYRVKLETT